MVDLGKLPDVSLGALKSTPLMRFSNFFPDPVARDLLAELVHGLTYEHVDWGGITSQRRAVRPLGDVYYGEMVRRPGWSTPVSVEAALTFFESREFTDWLSELADEPIQPVRPLTAFRLDPGDVIALHDDMTDPLHALGVVYNLSEEWNQSWGGRMRYGQVIGTRPLPTPPDCPIDLTEWVIDDEERLVPEFNSLVVMRLDLDHAHGVERVVGPASRHTLLGPYQRVS